ncbi:MAG TPA: glycosyltransferase family 2 protein [Ktedonobacteraceae bacterium]|nr:glycosyltransferase family 2 protein [Ktedonobacteraceae bacterium]
MRRVERLPTVSVVIPTLNEAKNLPHVLPELPDVVSEVVLVDGGSRDETIAVARELRPDIRILRQTGRGKGNALAEGFAASTGEIIVMMDADGSHDPHEILLFVDALMKGAEFAKGSRYIHDGGSGDFTWTRRFGNTCINLLANACFHVQFTDLCYGYNAFWRRFLPYLDIDSPGFEVETLMNIRARKANLKVKEVPSFEADRLFGESKLKAMRDGWRIVKTILRERLGERRRSTLYSSAGVSK